MITKMFAIHDRAASAFMAPFFTHSEGLASRMVSDAVLDPKTSLHAHPGDYDLFILGEFDDQSGLYTAEPVPRRICPVSDFVVK